MNIIHASRKLSIVLLIVLLGCAKCAVPKAQLKAVSILSQQFETIFYSRTGLLSSSGRYKNLSEQDANNLRAPFAYLLTALGKGPSSDLFANGKAVLVGAKEFRPPAGLGSVHFQSCYVVILRNKSTFDFQRYFRQSATPAGSGLPIWNWSAELSEFGEMNAKPSFFYATQVAQSYALVCNDLPELRTLAEKLAVPDVDPKDSTQNSEWHEVSQQEVWGYRRYRHIGVTDKVAAGMADITSSAQTLLFFADPKKKIGVLRLLAADASTADKMNSGMTKNHAALPALKQSGPQAWELSIDLIGDQKSSEQMFDVMTLFGFGIYL
jgi:hypothetical protein